MSFGAGDGSHISRPGELLASEADREAVQALLKKAYEDQRLTLEEFEARVGRAVAARTTGELRELTRDLPAGAAGPPPARTRPRRGALLAGGIAVLPLAGVIVLLAHVLTSGPPRPASAAAVNVRHTAVAPKPSPPPGPGGPARCPLGTSPAALAIANALATDPVYADPAAPPLTQAQEERLRAAITRDDPGRVRIAALTHATVRRGGGERALANAIASCPADAPGVTLLTTSTAAYLVTSYAPDRPTTQAVGAALNIHASMAAGLLDAIKRIALLDPRHN
jgi:uncharacterized protein DUF1707